MEYYCYKAKKALYHHGRKNLPYSTDLNPYSGCSHRCIYCYAAASRLKRGSTDLIQTGFKENITELLEKELYSFDYSRRIINIGGSTDSYQNCEADTKEMREILKLMIRFKVPVIISTKSNLIIRDLDLIKELSKLTYVNIAFSISTLDPVMSKIFEPGTPDPVSRISALKDVSKEGINSALHFFPAIPFVSDTDKMIESIVRAASDSSCSYLMPGFLYLTGNIKEMFFKRLNSANPELGESIREAYKSGKISNDIKFHFYSRLNKACSQYKVETNYRQLIPDKFINDENRKKSDNSPNKEQLELF